MIRTRRYFLKGWGWFDVPRYIVRLDHTNEHGHLKSAGWQVRYERPSKYFSDSDACPGSEGRMKRGSPKESLQRARAYLATIYRGERPPLRIGDKANKKHRTGVAGMRYVRKRHHQRNLWEYYVEVSHMPGIRSSPRRFYIGTENTFTQERLEIAWQRAYAFRIELVSRKRSAAARAGVFCRSFPPRVPAVRCG